MKDALNWNPALLGEVALRTTAVYLLLLALVRIAGKRQIAQLTPFDLVVLLLLSNAVQNAMTGPDTSLTGGIAAAVTLILVNLAIARLRLRYSGFRRWIEGVPVVLVSHGEIQYMNLQREQLTEEELLAALREHEANDVQLVELAMLEVDGSVSVIRKDAISPQGFHHSRRRFVRHHEKPN